MSALSEKMLAALTKAVRPSATRRRTGCSPSSSRGVAKNMPISSAPSSAGISQVGPAVSRLGSSSCSAIAARIVAWAGQNGSATAGGG